MSFLLALHHGEDITIATTSPVVPADQVQALDSALKLAHEVSQLHVQQETLVSDAREQAQKQGHEAGFAQGCAAAQTDVERELSQGLNRFLLAQTTQRQELKSAVVALATAMVQQTLADLGPAVVMPALLARNFEGLVPAQTIRIRMAPATMTEVREQVEANHQHLSLQWIAQETMSPWACEVETDTGRMLLGLQDVLGNLNQSLQQRQRMAGAEAA